MYTINLITITIKINCGTFCIVQKEEATSLCPNYPKVYKINYDHCFL